MKNERTRRVESKKNEIKKQRKDGMRTNDVEREESSDMPNHLTKRMGLLITHTHTHTPILLMGQSVPMRR